MDRIGFSLSRCDIFLQAFCSLLLAAGLSPALAQDNAATPASEDVATPLSPDIASADLLRAGVDENQLKPGEFAWLPAAQNITGAPLMIIVNLSGQRAYVYRDGQPIAVTTVSTGRPGRETPTGTFEILAKERMHHSNIYDDAPMPFMQRLTWTGLSLHAGNLPGHPASHGCIRLPPKFAERLYGLTERGEVVVITDDGSAEALARAGLQTQIDLAMGTASMIHQVVEAVGPAPAPATESNSIGSDSVSQSDDQETDGAFSHSR